MCIISLFHHLPLPLCPDPLCSVNCKIFIGGCGRALSLPALGASRDRRANNNLVPARNKDSHNKRPNVQCDSLRYLLTAHA